LVTGHGFDENSELENGTGIAVWTVEKAVLFLEGTELRLPFRHDTIFSRVWGERNFTLYSGRDFDGESKCVVGSEHRRHIRNLRPGHAAGLEPTFEVRSIKRGCSTDPDPPCGTEGYEYEILGYTWKNPIQFSDDNSDPILKCN